MSGKPVSKDCTVFGRCGGCSSLDVPYSEQLAAKDSEIARLFEGIAPSGSIKPIIGMEEPYRYRNKAIAPFVRGRRKRGRRPQKGAKLQRAAKPEIVSGMYAKGTHDVVECDSCLLENEVAGKVVRAIKSIMRKHGIEPYDEDAGTGFMRHAVVRVGHNSGEVLVTLVTNADEFPYAKSFCRELVRQVPEITSIVQNVNKRQTNVVLGDRTNVLYGPGFILDELCGCSFRISSSAFYQVNAKQTEVLYNEAIRLAGLEGGELVIDAYCGTGTIGLAAISRSNGADIELIGVDCVESAIRDARQNASHNGAESASFAVADAAEFMERLAEERQGANGHEAGSGSEAVRKRPIVLFMDPPRSGSTPEFLDAAAKLRPEKIVYISCNPETQVRDVSQLAASGYSVKEVQPVDMFPQTPHIECIVLLEDSDG